MDETIGDDKYFIQDELKESHTTGRPKFYGQRWRPLLVVGFDE